MATIDEVGKHFESVAQLINAYDALTRENERLTRELIAAGELHLADETTIRQLERALAAKDEERAGLRKAFLKAWALFDRFRMGTHPLESSQRWQQEFDYLRDYAIAALKGDKSDER